jgi:nitrogen fixation NifU-like protein
MSDDLNDLYQEVILDHNKSPRNRGALTDATQSAEGHNPLCGDHVQVFLKVRDGIVIDVTFEGSGCAISMASASMMTESVKGKTLEEAKELFRNFHEFVTRDKFETDLGDGLGKLEVFSGVCQYPARVKCATLAWHTIQAAIDDDDSNVVSTE